MTNLDQFKHNFKKDVLIRVIVAMRHNRTTQKDASYLARQILEIFKEEKASEVFKKINKLAEKHPDVLEILIERGTEYDEVQRKENINKIQVYLKGGIN